MAPQPLSTADPASTSSANPPKLGAAGTAALVIFLFYLVFALVCLTYLIFQRRSSCQATHSALGLPMHQTVRTTSRTSFLSPYVAAPTSSEEAEPRISIGTNAASTEEPPPTTRTDSASTNDSPTNLAVYIPETQRTRARSSSGATLIPLHSAPSTRSLQCDGEHESESSPGSEDEQLEVEHVNLEAGQGRMRASSSVSLPRYYPGNAEVVLEVGSLVEKQKRSFLRIFTVRL